MCGTDEAKVESSAIESDRRIRCKAGQELQEELLAPCFKLVQTSVGCWAAYIHGSRTIYQEKYFLNLD